MTEDISGTVGANVRAEMARRRITQDRVADLLGISQPQVSKRLNGDIAFDVVELDKLADLLGIPAATLLERVA